MKELKDKNDIPQQGFVIIDFWAEWCIGCRRLELQIETIASELKSIPFFKVNCDEAPQLCTDFIVRSIPMVVLLKDGEEVDRRVGSEQCKNLKQWIEYETRTK